MFLVPSKCLFRLKMLVLLGKTENLRNFPLKEPAEFEGNFSRFLLAKLDSSACI